MSSPSPNIPQRSSPVVPLSSGKKSDTSLVCLWGEGSPTEIPLACQRHVASASGYPATPPPGPRRSQGTKPVVTDRPGVLVPLPSSSYFKPHQTGYPPRGGGGRASRISSRNFFIAPPCRTTPRGCQTPPAAKPGQLTQPGHPPYRKS